MCQMVVVDEQLLGGLINIQYGYIKHPEIGIRLCADDSDTFYSFIPCKYNYYIVNTIIIL